MTSPIFPIDTQIHKTWGNNLRGIDKLFIGRILLKLGLNQLGNMRGALRSFASRIAMLVA